MSIDLPDNFYYLKIYYFGHVNSDKSSEVTIWNNPNINNICVATRHGYLHEKSVKTYFDDLDESLLHATKFIKGYKMPESKIWIIMRHETEEELRGWQIVEVLDSKFEAIERCKEIVTSGQKSIYLFKIEMEIKIANPPVEITEFS